MENVHVYVYIIYVLFFIFIFYSVLLSYIMDISITIASFANNLKKVCKGILRTKTGVD